jgi:hypothetical protein
MAINCVTNALQDIADNLQDGLNEQINNLTDAGKAGLAALENKAELALAGIKNAIPELPQLDNFKTELAALLAAPDQLEQKLGELADKWGSAIPDLDDILSKITSIDFDFCSMVPNVDLDADGTPIVKDSESKLTTEPPPKVANLKKEEQAVDNSTTSKGKTNSNISQYNKVREKIKNNKDLKAIEDAIKKTKEAIATVGEGDYSESDMDRVLNEERLNRGIKSKAGMNRIATVLDNFAGGDFITDYKPYTTYLTQEKAAIDVLVARTFMHTALGAIQFDINTIKECITKGRVKSIDELETFITSVFKKDPDKYRGLPIIYKEFGDTALSGWTYKQVTGEGVGGERDEPRYSLRVLDEGFGSLEDVLKSAFRNLFPETQANAAYANNDSTVEIKSPEISTDDESGTIQEEPVATAETDDETVAETPAEESSGISINVAQITAAAAAAIPMSVPSTPVTGGGSSGGGGSTGGGGSSGGGGGGY